MDIIIVIDELTILVALDSFLHCWYVVAFFSNDVNLAAIDGQACGRIDCHKTDVSLGKRLMNDHHITYIE